MLKTVAREQTLVERAQHQFEELMAVGKLRPGDRLPSEAQMAQMLGVSRTVVREAVRVLSARGLVESRSGSGIYVKQLNTGLIKDPIELLLRFKAIDPADIVEVRGLIEVHLAGLAAERATEEHLQHMEESITRLSDPTLSSLESAEIDVEFHALLAVAAGNPLFGVLSHSINAVMLDPIRFTFEWNPGAREETIQEHRSIYDRVKARDVQGAREAMAASLVDAPRNWGGFRPLEPLLAPAFAGRLTAKPRKAAAKKKPPNGSRHDR